MNWRPDCHVVQPGQFLSAQAILRSYPVNTLTPLDGYIARTLTIYHSRVTTSNSRIAGRTGWLTATLTNSATLTTAQARRRGLETATTHT